MIALDKKYKNVKSFNHAQFYFIHTLTKLVYFVKEFYIVSNEHNERTFYSQL